jgi:hypothetical protein
MSSVIFTTRLDIPFLWERKSVKLHHRYEKCYINLLHKNSASEGEII